MRFCRFRVSVEEEVCVRGDLEESWTGRLGLGYGRQAN